LDTSFGLGTLGGGCRFGGGNGASAFAGFGGLHVEGVVEAV